MDDGTIGQPIFDSRACPHWNQYCLQCVSGQVSACIERNDNIMCPQRCGKYLLYTDMRKLLNSEVITPTVFDRYQSQKRVANLISSPNGDWIW